MTNTVYGAPPDHVGIDGSTADRLGQDGQNSRDTTSPDDEKSLLASVQRHACQRATSYPTPPQRGGVTETIYGVKVHDPWRALERAESDRTLRFVDEQNEFSRTYLHSKCRGPLEQAVKQAMRYARTSCPMLQGDGFYYWLYNPGDAPRDVMVRARDVGKSFGKSPADVDGPEIFFDPAKLPRTSLYDYSWSPSGRYFTAVLQESGSDWQAIRTVDTYTRNVVGEDLGMSKFTFGVCWVNDFGFIYKRLLTAPTASLTEADGKFGLFYHALHTTQTDDVNIWKGTGVDANLLIVGRPYLCSADINGRGDRRTWIFIDVYRNTNPETETFMIEVPERPHCASGHQLARLVHRERRWISRGFTGLTTYVGTLSDDRHIFLSTCDGHSSGHIIAVDFDNLGPLSGDQGFGIAELVPEHSEGYTLKSAHLGGDDVLILLYLRDACASVVFHSTRSGKTLDWTDSQSMDGVVMGTSSEEQDGEISSLPECAAIGTISARKDADDFYISVDTLTKPPYILCGRFSARDKHVSLDDMVMPIARSKTGNEDEVVCRQILYRSHDGILIPMFICHSSRLDRSKPCLALLHAYGGFAVPMLPHYDPMFMAFVRQLGGIVALACIRGGGEYGKRWHDAAVGRNRTVAFDDFAYAAHYLHDQGLSTPSLTAIYGSSNGGLLVLASMNRHPELFGAVLADVAVTDLVRYPLFTLGRLWQSEYGSPSDPAMLPFLHSISPLHNVDSDPAKPYPALLVTTGDHDTRVIPGHSLKFLAEVQTRKPENKGTFLGRIYANAGHESDSRSTAEKIEEATDRLVFLMTFLTEV